MSAEEIKAILEDQSKIDAVVGDVFNTFDKDGNGFIEEDELKAAVAEFSKGAGGDGDVGEDQIKDALKGLDQNNDGKLDKSEFAALVVEILKSLAG